MNHERLYTWLTGEPDHDAIRAWAADAVAGFATAPSRAGVLHPLGFLCLPVERAGRFGVCVHVWSDRLPSAHSTTSDIHCHSWELLSYVLHGRLRNEIPAVDDTADHPTHRLFEVVSGGDVDEIVPTTRTVRCADADGYEHGTGDVYRLPAGIFHRSVVPPGVDTVTVALGRELPGGDDLSLGPLETGPHRVPRRRCDLAETSLAARIAGDHLAAGRAAGPGPDSAGG